MQFAPKIPERVGVFPRRSEIQCSSIFCRATVSAMKILSLMILYPRVTEFQPETQVERIRAIFLRERSVFA